MRIATPRLFSTCAPRLAKMKRIRYASSPTSVTDLYLPNDLTEEQLLSFQPFTSWHSRLTHNLKLQLTTPHSFSRSPYILHEIRIQSVDYFGRGGEAKRVGFLKLATRLSNSEGESLPGVVFLRGGSVAILLILEIEPAEGETEPAEGVAEPAEGVAEPAKGPGDRWVVLTVQPRIPAGSLEMVELPAGMIDNAGTFSGAAAKEIKEECGIEIQEDKLVDLTALALGPLVDSMQERLEPGVYPSPGGSDEYIKCFAYRHRIAKDTLEEWQGKLTGLRSEGEKITLKVVRFRDLWKETMDAKALASIALWEGLEREGKV